MAEQRMRPRKRKKVCSFCVDKVTVIEDWAFSRSGVTMP